MEIYIQFAKENDAEQITDILISTEWFPQLKKKPRQEVVAMIRKRILGTLHNSGHMCFVARTGRDEIIGYINAHRLPYLFLFQEELYISELFIKENHRGKGVGTRLIDHLKEIAKATGIGRLMLVTGKNRSSYHRDFYKKIGWAERTQIANFICPIEPAGS